MNTNTDTSVEILIGQRLRRARKKNRHTQASLAMALGLSFQQLQKYENGSNRISVSRLVETSIALNEPVEFFICDVKAHLSGKPLLSTPADSESETVIYGWGLLVDEIADPQFKKTIIDLIKRHNNIVAAQSHSSPQQNC